MSVWLDGIFYTHVNSERDNDSRLIQDSVKYSLYVSLQSLVSEVRHRFDTTLNATENGTKRD